MLMINNVINFNLWSAKEGSLKAGLVYLFAGIDEN